MIQHHLEILKHHNSIKQNLSALHQHILQSFKIVQIKQRVHILPNRLIVTHMDKIQWHSLHKVVPMATSLQEV